MGLKQFYPCGCVYENHLEYTGGTSYRIITIDNTDLCDNHRGELIDKTIEVLNIRKCDQIASYDEDIDSLNKIRNSKKKVKLL